MPYEQAKCSSSQCLKRIVNDFTVQNWRIFVPLMVHLVCQNLNHHCILEDLETISCQCSGVEEGMALQSTANPAGYLE